MIPRQFPGIARPCKYRLLKLTILPTFAHHCGMLRRRWCRNGVDRCASLRTCGAVAAIPSSLGRVSDRIGIVDTMIFGQSKGVFRRWSMLRIPLTQAESIANGCPRFLRVARLGVPECCLPVVSGRRNLYSRFPHVVIEARLSRES